MRYLLIGWAAGMLTMLAVQASDVLYFYRPMKDEVSATLSNNAPLFYRWVKRDGCTPIYGPQENLWGLKCPRFRLSL